MSMTMEYLLKLCQSGIYQSDTRQQMLLAEKARKYIKENAISFNTSEKGHVVCTNYPIYEACRVGYMDLVKAFLDSGARLNVIDEEGKTPLYTAISSHRNKHSNIVKLIQWGANVNLYKHGKVPLLSAFYGMDTEVTKLLIYHGADVNNVNLPSFCFVESLFALNSGMVMMAAGVRFHFENFEELLSMGTEIVLAGLTPRCIYLSGKSFLAGNLTDTIMADLWEFQFLCLSLGFKVEMFCLREAMAELQANIQSSQDAEQVSLLKQRLEKFDWIRQFLSTPLPLTYLARIAIRCHLVSPKVNKGRHIRHAIGNLPLPSLARDFLAMKYQGAHSVCRNR